MRNQPTAHRHSMWAGSYVHAARSDMDYHSPLSRLRCLAHTMLIQAGRDVMLQAINQWYIFQYFFFSLRNIANAPWFVSNHTLHTDLNIPYVCEVINERINKHLNKLESHPSPLLETLKQPMRNRRLKRRWTSDLQDR